MIKEKLKKEILALIKSAPPKVLGRAVYDLPENSKIREVLDETVLKNYVEKTDFSNLDLKNRRLMKINKAEFGYVLANVCFFENMVKNIVYCLALGFIPAVEFINESGGALWTDFFKNPYEDKIIKENISPAPPRLRKFEYCPYKSAPCYFPAFPAEDDVKTIGKLYKAFFVPNDKTRKYFDDEYGSLLKGRRVLGVLTRGTDYVKVRPKGHPVQPGADDVIKLCEEKISELHFDYVYLATEEESVLERFNENFPGMVIVNKRRYFDEYYKLNEENPGTLISAVNFERENDEYYKSLEYFSSINLLSKCDGLIAGCCGGSRAALYLNFGNYEYSHLFNLGLY